MTCEGQQFEDGTSLLTCLDFLHTDTLLHLNY